MKPLALLLGFLALQQTAPPPKPATQSGTNVTIRETFFSVPVLFTATDRRDRFITDLAKADVEVFDNRKKQAVAEFVRETDLPLRVGILVDTSNSIRDRFKFEQEAAVDFLKSIVRKGQDQAFMMSFDSSVEVVQDFTDNVEKLGVAIRSLKAGGGTSLYDAIYHAARDKFLNHPEGTSVRKVLVVIGDGDDNLSRASREETLAISQRAELTIYTISTNISGIEQPGDKILKRFAEETGGRAFSPFRIQDMASSYDTISQELRSQYSLLFRPNTQRDGAFHTIEVVSLRKGVKVRARKGYFATP